MVFRATHAQFPSLQIIYDVRRLKYAIPHVPPNHIRFFVDAIWNKNKCEQKEKVDKINKYVYIYIH